MTPMGIGKSVIQTDCHINRSFLVQEGPFWNKNCHIKRLSYYPVSYYPGSTVPSFLNLIIAVPDVVVRCARFVEEHAITDGIYRVSGVASNIKRLRSRFIEDDDDQRASESLYDEPWIVQVNFESLHCGASAQL